MYLSKDSMRQRLQGVAPQQRKQVVNSLMSSGYQIEGLNAPSKAPAAQAQAPAAPAKKAGLGANLANFGAQTTSGLSRGVGNTLEFGGKLTDWALPKKLEKYNPFRVAGKGFTGAGDVISDRAKSFYGTTDDSFSTKAGQFTGEVGSMFAGGGAGAKAGQALAKVGAKALPKFAGKVGSRVAPKLTSKVAPRVGAAFSSPLGQKAAQGVGYSMGGTQGAVAAGSGEFATAKDYGIGGMIDAGTFGIGRGLRGLSDYSYSRLVPSTITQKGKDIARGTNIGRAIGDEIGFSVTRKGAMKKMKSAIGRYSSQLDDAIDAANKGDVPGLLKRGERAGLKFTADDLIGVNPMKKVLSNNAKLRNVFGRNKEIKRSISKSLDEFRSTVGKRTLDLRDVQNLKKSLGQSLSGFYSKTDDAAATARELINDIIRKNAKGIVEENVKVAKGLNQKMGPLLESMGRMKKKGGYSSVLTDTIAATGAGAVGMSSGSPENAAKNAILGILLNRFTKSAGARTGGGATFKAGANVAENEIARNLIKASAIRGGIRSKERDKEFQERLGATQPQEAQPQY